MRPNQSRRKSRQRRAAMTNERKDSRVAVRLVQLAKVIRHRCMAQQFSHPIVVCARGFQEEPPELATFGVEHAELKGNTQKSLDAFESMILVRLRNVLRNALQRVER